MDHLIRALSAKNAAKKFVNTLSAKDDLVMAIQYSQTDEMSDRSDVMKNAPAISAEEREKDGLGDDGDTTVGMTRVVSPQKREPFDASSVRRSTNHRLGGFLADAEVGDLSECRCNSLECTCKG